MIILSINLLILSVGLLIVGLIKPGWILFWMEKPGRMPIIILSSVLFMVGVVMFTEANLEKVNANPPPVSQTKEASETPVPAVDEKTKTIKEVK
ncbi:MAG: hypothetical protein L3J59_00835 [Methylococcaceae bacterium]|nr:hypothetical protein [Methylococcaceae bacterium]